MQREDEIAIIGLGRLRAIELRDRIPAEYFIKEESAAAASRTGELGTALLVFALAAPVATGIAGWLLAARKNDEVQFEYERRGADGSFERTRFSHKVSEKEASDPNFVEKLGGLILSSMRAGAAPA